MADIKWIKIVTDIFDDEKILLIESMPDADGIIVIWFKLLCLAGKQNNSGVFIMPNGIPYNEKMLSTIFRRKESAVSVALKAFEQFGMIEIMNEAVTITNWGKHQNIDGIETHKEKNRLRQQSYRDRQRLLANNNMMCDDSKDANIYCDDSAVSNVTHNVTHNVSNVTHNAIVTPLDKERDKEEEKERDKDGETARARAAPAAVRKKPPKVQFAEFVSMTNDERSSLVAKYGEHCAARCIEILDNYKGASGKKYASDYRAILNWVVKRYEDERQQQQTPHGRQPSNGGNQRPKNIYAELAEKARAEKKLESEAICVDNG